jgi:uncharacterized membrane protein YfcA
MASTQVTAPAVPSKPSSTGPIVAIALIALAIVLYFTLDTKTAAPDFTVYHFAALGFILYFAGLASGMTGFAFSAIGAIALFLLPPIVAVPMLQACSFFNQMLSIGKLRKDMPKALHDWFPYGPGPAILGGLAGVEAGVWILNHLPGAGIMLILGILITLYSLYSTFKPKDLIVQGFGGWPTGVVVGALGGAIGGFTAFPGLPVVLWVSLRDLAKAKARAIVQPFIVTLQLAALITNAIHHPHNFGKPFWIMLALTVPAVLPGTLTGLWIYHRISEVNFKRVVFILLLVTGVGLLLKGWGGLH